MAGRVLSASDKLMTAASTGNTELVIQLLANSSSSTLEPDENGFTALHYAAINGHARLVENLVTRGYKVDARDSAGYTALHLAASRGHLDVVRALLVVSRSVNNQDKIHGNTAIHEAAWNGFSQTLQELVFAKANVNAINNAGFSALHLAAQNGHNESSRILLFAGCSPDHKNGYGDTPLHTAARYGHAGVTRILVSAKCAVSETNKNGDTALHIATALKQKKITKLLLEAGIDVAVVNSQRETALDIARRKDNDELIVLLTNVKVGSSRRQLPMSAVNVERSVIPSAAVTLPDRNQKWPSMFRQNKSKDRLHVVLADISSSSADDQNEVETPTLATVESRAAPTDVLRDFQQYQVLKRQHEIARHSAHPVDSRAVVIPGVAGHYAMRHGTQYYRDLAGNVKQGPVGYIPTPSLSHNWTPVLQNDAACSRHQQDVLCHGQQQRVRDSNHHDHLTYLRSRRQPVAYPKAPLPTYMSHMFSGGGPTYADQAGRVWPVPKSGTLGGPHPGWPAPPPHSGPTAVDTSLKNVRCSGQRPIYRSRSDETLSTISSHASRHRHRGKHCIGTERSGRRRMAERSRNRGDPATTNELFVPTSVPDAAPPSSDPVPTDEVTCSAAAEEQVTEAVDPAPSKSAHVDSSSNPDSGYSGASGMAVSHLAPCSETLSLHSASSGDLASNPPASSSVRSDSVPSICNSL